VILEQTTTFDTIKEADTLIVYHSCSTNKLKERFNNNPDKNIHAGTLLQALCRADYKINDEELYKKAYVYEIKIELDGVCPDLVKDDGKDSDSSMEDTYKSNWNILVYKNVGEGRVEDENLSVIILNKKVIKSVKLHSKWNGKTLEQELYPN
jgi:hypothetical protein